MLYRQRACGQISSIANITETACLLGMLLVGYWSVIFWFVKSYWKCYIKFVVFAPTDFLKYKITSVILCVQSTLIWTVKKTCHTCKIKMPSSRSTEEQHDIISQSLLNRFLLKLRCPDASPRVEDIQGLLCSWHIRFLFSYHWLHTVEKLD